MTEIIPVIPETEEHKALVAAAGDAINDYLAGLGFAGFAVRPYALAREALNATLPLVEELVLRRASDQLRAWADQIVDPGISGPRAIRRRTLMAAASRILPKLSPAELAEKIASGEAYVIHCTGLDVDPAETTEPSGSVPFESAPAAEEAADDHR